MGGKSLLLILPGSSFPCLPSHLVLNSSMRLILIFEFLTLSPGWIICPLAGATFLMFVFLLLDTTRWHDFVIQDTSREHLLVMVLGAEVERKGGI